MYSNQRSWFNVNNVLFFLKKIKREIVGPNNQILFSLWLQKGGELIPVTDIKVLRGEIAFVNEGDASTRGLIDLNMVIEDLDRINNNAIAYAVMSKEAVGPVVAVKYELEKQGRIGKAILVSDWKM